MSEPFRYHPDVGARFPVARAEVLRVEGLGGGPVDALTARYRAAQSEIAATLETVPPAERPTIRAWRSAFAGFGVKPTQHRNAAEALLRRLQRHGDIPSIGPTVDLGNLVSITHSLPVAVFDLDAVTLPVDVVFASGDETFTGIGSQEAEHPAPGEVIFVDGASQVVARRWCWKQGAGAATSPTTARAMYVIEGVDDDAERSVSAAADDLESLVRGHLAGVSVDRLQVRPG